MMCYPSYRDQRSFLHPTKITQILPRRFRTLQVLIIRSNIVNERFSHFGENFCWFIFLQRNHLSFYIAVLNVFCHLLGQLTNWLIFSFIILYQLDNSDTCGS